ncbi:MAG: zinc ribbon domain-containing protein, partial [Clostridia bacterium]|nr:zinc ribbon domain-containing protein [Clostridia bacterium]
MICPNCGRQISDSAIRCPHCYAMIHAYKRRRAEANVPEDEPARVKRRVQPVPAQQQADNEKANDYAEARADAAKIRNSQNQGNREQRQPVKRGSAETQRELHIPRNVQRSESFKEGDVRYVRHPGNQVRKKVNARPAMENPPINRKSHKRFFIALRIILILLFFMTASGTYILTQTEDGQQTMAEWGWSVARTDAYITLGKQLL